MEKRACIIFNGNAGQADERSVIEALAHDWGIAFHLTEEPEDGTTLARQALEDGYTRLIAAGGDGTLHQIAQVVLATEGAATLGVLPMGTGNDYARTLALPPTPERALGVALGDRTARLDVIRVTSGSKSTCAINASAGGFVGEINQVVTGELKATWGPLAYVLGTMRALPDLKEYHVSVAFDDAPPEDRPIINAVVANGRTIGGGKHVAARANPCDGLIDVVTVRWTSVAELAEVGTRLLAGTWLDHPSVTHRRVRTLHVSAEPDMWFNVDGELFTKEPVTFEVVPGALPVAVGADFACNPDEAA